GRTLHAFSSGPSEWTERNLTQHARVAGVHQVLLMDSMPAAMELGGGRIRLVDVASVQQLPFLEEPGQLVVLHGKGWPDLDRLSLLHAERWVLNGDMDGGARARMRRWAQEHGSPVHDMRAQGAYVRP
ncbi:MAG: hypothetical protein KBF80_07865, partial [Flavobacteriales bacterium]|nr:hypothetical protein [Flavobacteriales bacterium]